MEAGNNVFKIYHGSRRMKWFLGVTLLVILLVFIYTRSMPPVKQSGVKEPFMGFINSHAEQKNSPDGRAPDLAVFQQGLPLQDILVPVYSLSPLTAGDCANLDVSRIQEVGGQYVQRTNNYKRDYPDTCTAPLTEFVGAVYASQKLIGSVVPCAHAC
jgi:hypothetical protein